MLIGMLVVVYLFVGGSGAGALFVTCAWSLAFHRREDRTFVVTEAFEGLKRKGLFVGVALVVVSSVFLLLDLGRPELFFLLFARPTPTPISFGSFSWLPTSSWEFSSSLRACLSARPSRRLPRRRRKCCAWPFRSR